MKRKKQVGKKIDKTENQNGKSERTTYWLVKNFKNEAESSLEDESLDESQFPSENNLKNATRYTVQGTRRSNYIVNFDRFKL